MVTTKNARVMRDGTTLPKSHLSEQVIMHHKPKEEYMSRNHIMEVFFFFGQNQIKEVGITKIDFLI